jgi:hypothetical protein
MKKDAKQIEINHLKCEFHVTMSRTLTIGKKLASLTFKQMATK